jgi:hypothetical protein
VAAVTLGRGAAAVTTLTGAIATTGADPSGALDSYLAAAASFGVTPDLPGSHSVEKPRWTPESGPYSPTDHRRPDFRRRQFRMIEVGPIDRLRDGLRTIAEARVSIYFDPLPERVQKPIGSTRQELGHDLERAIRDDVAYGSKIRESHNAGEKTRHGDVGASEVKSYSTLSSEDLDQIWRDLLNPARKHTAHLIVPQITHSSAMQLARMAAIFEKLTGIRPHISIREYGSTHTANDMGNLF